MWQDRIMQSSGRHPLRISDGWISVGLHQPSVTLLLLLFQNPVNYRVASWNHKQPSDADTESQGDATHICLLATSLHVKLHVPPCNQEH